MALPGFSPHQVLIIAAARFRAGGEYRKCPSGYLLAGVADGIHAATFFAIGGKS